MKFGVVVFPGSNCDHDAYHALGQVLHQPVEFLWHQSEQVAGFDAIVTPALGFLATLAPRIEEDLETALAGDDPLGSAGNLLGLPAIALPGPLVRGLPTGMQLLGPAWSEELLCAAASALEEVTPWAAQRPQRARQ